MRLRTFLAAAISVLLVRDAAGAAPPKIRFPFWACSDGKGAVSLFWLPSLGQWPAGGFRLERIVGKGKAVVVPLIKPGADDGALAKVSAEEAARIGEFAEKLGKGLLTEEERERSALVLGRAAAASPDFGRALGVRYTDRGGGPSRRTYRLTLLAADGSPGEIMETGPVDPGKRTPGPERPADLRAEAGPGGISLFWSDPPASSVAPVVAFRVDRADARGKTVRLTRTPLLLDRHLKPGTPEFADPDPGRSVVTYEVRSIDIFGRSSVAARVRVAGAGVPGNGGGKAGTVTAPGPGVPASGGAAPLQAAAGGGAAAGPAEAARASAAETPGTPSPPPASREAPARKTAGGDGRSAALSPQKPQDAAPAAPVEAAPPAPPEARWGPAGAPPPGGPPPSPEIVSISGTNRKVVLAIRPGVPDYLTDSILVIRSDIPGGEGIVVGRPIPAGTREWEDQTVEVGQYFWYRLVAVDRSGKRSAPSKSRWVRVSEN